MIKNGFTLAEVLITLVIIGIIAAMTIPNLINRTDEQEKVVAVF
ncbi:MAG: prepilin-type N-terminal cleavage/methylation domain-containing protein [bacterium]|nr:prepilin-type N-terminal cleavage/methylation domain-containing protein [bacterium]